MMIGSSAAVIKSPVAQAPSMASAINWSVMPCRLGCRRLCQPALITGMATNSEAAPSSN
ncbi:ABC transporter permease [Pseudomonas syringae pv. spinaceae]|uniref:ABC transporter permease n=1 Tax=Pseudomonas syringae pv. spinaceae TaxID=264459 RepID=A0A0Q0BXQ5_PSESX|nr:ABC transporter permease [Pseudomonas syringae pv. spinaceae]